jgi:hypothetical protein
MEKYEIWLIVFTVSVMGTAFKIVIEDLRIFKILRIKRIFIIFNSTRTYRILKKMKNTVMYYHNYTLIPLSISSK